MEMKNIKLQYETLNFKYEKQELLIKTIFNRMGWDLQEKD